MDIPAFGSSDSLLRTRRVELAAHGGRPILPEEPQRESPDRAVDLGWARVPWELVEQLPDRQRSVIVLRYVHDLPIREIARREGIAAETVRDALARAHARLRRMLERT